MPSAILLGTEAPSGQLTSRAAQFLPLSFTPRAAGLVHLGDLGPLPWVPFPSSMDKAVGTDARVQGTWDQPFLCHQPPLWASVSLSVPLEGGSLTLGPSPAVPFFDCEILRAEAGRSNGPSLPTTSPCPSGSPQRRPLPRLPGTSLQLQAW